MDYSTLVHKHLFCQPDDNPLKALDTQLAIFRLSMWPFHHTMPRNLTTTPCDMIQTSGTAHILFQHPKKPWHVPRPAMCSITLLKDHLRNSDQPQCHALLYIVSHSLTLEWHVPCAPSCLKFYLCYKLSLHLTHVLQFYPATLIYFFVSLSATNQLCSHFILSYFTIKPPVHRIIRRRIPHLCNFTFRLCLTLISLSCLSAALSIIVPLCAPSPKDAPFHVPLPKLHPTSPCIALSHPTSPYTISSWIHLGILHIHYITYISLFLIGCWRKG